MEKNIKDKEYAGVYIDSCNLKEKHKLNDSRNKKINIFNNDIISTIKEKFPI